MKQERHAVQLFTDVKEANFHFKLLYSLNIIQLVGISCQLSKRMNYLN